MKFKVISFNEVLKKYIFKTALYTAVEKENIEILKILLTNNELDINLGYILNIFL